MSDIKNKIKPGTTILIAEPFAFLLSAKYRLERCDYCFKWSDKLSRCSKCQYVYYCNRNCQKLAWTIHKIECPNIKRVHPRIVPDAARMMARIIIKLNNGGENERGYYTETEYRTFNDLMSHVSNIKKNIDKMEHFTTVSMVLWEFLPKDMLPSPEILLEIFGRLTINSFHILDIDMTSIGIGLYLGPSIIDHSCKPNAFTIFEGTKIKIKSLCNLPSLDWSKITVTYISIFNTTKDRRADLRASYYFYCECERCNAPEICEIAAACQNKKCTNPCLPTDNYCNKCGTKFPNDFKKQYDKICKLSENNLMKMNDEACLDTCKVNLKIQEGLLHPLNLLAVRTLETAVRAIDMANLEEFDMYAIQLIPPYEYYYGEEHPITTLLYFTWGKVLSMLNKRARSLEALQKAYTRMTVIFGDDHPKVRDELKPLIHQLVASYNI